MELTHALLNGSFVAVEGIAPVGVGAFRCNCFKVFQELRAGSRLKGLLIQLNLIGCCLNLSNGI